MLTSSRRTLVQALSVSLLLHVALLSCAVKRFSVRLAAPASTITALIRERGVAAPVHRASPTRSPSASAKPSAPIPRGAAVRQLVVAPAAAAPAEAPPPSAPNESPAPAPGTAGRSAALAASGPASLPIAAPGAGREGVSADDLRQYRLSLATAARHFKRYPPLARQRGWEGTVEVALTLSIWTPVPGVVLVRSSGHQVLDAQALDMLTQAARVTILPDGLKARNFRVLLPVQFSLEDEQ